jgi:CBS domain-containing membrane protein
MSNPEITSDSVPRALTVREKFSSSILAFVALVLVGLVSFNTIGSDGFPFIVASMGASSVLLFAVPYSPLSQPWPLVGGHIVSSTVGVSCAIYIPDSVLAAAAAVSMAIAAMHLTRCLHPPGGAVALAAVLGGQQVHSLGYLFVVYPVLVNTLLMLGVAWLLNNMVPGRRYPSSRGNFQGDDGSESWAGLANSISSQDFRSAVNSLDEFVDITGEQLDKLYKATVMQSHKRHLGDVRCEHIMSPDVVSIEQSASTAQAWRELQHHQLKALPVLDYRNRVIGIVTQSDLAKLVLDNATADSKCASEQDILARLEQTAVGVVMRAPVTTIGAESHVVDALSLIVDHHIHHLPVVDGRKVIKGMLSRTDLLALFKKPSLLSS